MGAGLGDPAEDRQILGERSAMELMTNPLNRGDRLPSQVVAASTVTQNS